MTRFVFFSAGMAVVFGAGVLTGNWWLVPRSRVPGNEIPESSVRPAAGGERMVDFAGAGDPRAFLEKARSSPVFSERVSGMAKMLEFWAETDPQQAAAYLMTIQSPALLVELVPGFMAVWVRHDPQGAARWTLDSVRGEVQTRAATALAAEWVKADPAEASRWLAAQPEGNLKSAASKSLFRSWGAAAPEDALRELARSGSLDGDHLTAEILIGAADKDPELARKIAAREAALKPGGNFLNEFVIATGFMDPVRTIEFLSGLPDSVDIEESVSTAASYAADVRPNEALDWAFSQPTDAKERSAIICSVAITLALNDPVNAMQRVKSLPDGPDAANYVENAVAILAAERPAATSAWIRRELQGGRKDAAINAFCQGERGQEFNVETAGLAAEIQNPALRTEVLGGYLGRTANEKSRGEIQMQLRAAGIAQPVIDSVLSSTP